MDLNQVTLPCADYEKSVSFYRTLGFRQIVDSPPNYARFECDSGTTFSLHKVDNLNHTSDIIVYFEVPNVDSVVQKLKVSGIDIEKEPVDQRWLWREAYLRDPAGNRLRIYHAGDNRRFPPWRL